MTQPGAPSSATPVCGGELLPPSEAAPLTDLVKTAASDQAKQARASPAFVCQRNTDHQSPLTTSTPPLPATTTPQGHFWTIYQSTTQSINHSIDQSTTDHAQNPIGSSGEKITPFIHPIDDEQKPSEQTNRTRSSPSKTKQQKPCAEPPSDKRSWRPAPAGRPPPPPADVPSRPRRRGGAAGTGTARSTTRRRGGCSACGPARRRRRRAGRAWRTTASAAAWSRSGSPTPSSLIPREF